MRLFWTGWMPWPAGCFRSHCRMRTLAVSLCLLAGLPLAGLPLAGPALGDEPETDGIAVPGLLSDLELYRLAACGAVPGGPCQTPELRWTKPELTLRIAPASDPLPPGLEARLETALTVALAEINSAGAGITIRRTSAAKADITLKPTGLAEGSRLANVPGFSAAGIMGVGYMSVWSDPSGTIVEAVILISTSITEVDLPSVLLEEVFQSLGFIYDVEGPAYEGVSILSQSSNETVIITGQDAALLRLHYPPSPEQDPP